MRANRGDTRDPVTQPSGKSPQGANIIYSGTITATAFNNKLKLLQAPSGFINQSNMKTQEPPAHKIRRNAVRSIEQKVSRLKDMQNTSNDLKKLNINELPLELDSDGYPDFHDYFFKPLENIALCPDDDESLEEFSVFDDPDEEEMRPIDWAEEISNYILSYVMAAMDVSCWPQQ